MRLLTKQEVDEILSLNLEDITMSLMKQYFARKVNEREPRFKITDYFNLPENVCSNNLPGFTTIGLYLFNKLVTDKYFKDVLGYINTPMTGKAFSKLYNIVSKALFEDKIDVDTFYFLIDMLEWLGGGDLGELITISLSSKLFTLPKKVKQRRAELFKQYAKEIEEGDVTIGAKIEAELVELTKKHLEKLPEWDNFASDAKLNFDNNYKTVMLMKGPIMDNATGTWKIAKSNYDEGIKKEEYAMFADSAVLGTYSRAKGVAIGGYTVKKFIASLQDIETAEEGSDCGTKDYLETVLDENLKEGYMYMNMVEGNKLVQITPDNIDNYVGKTVKLRSPMYCKHPSPKICNKCTGDYPYKLNLKTIGLATTKIGATLMNKRLKAFHNKKVYMYNVTTSDLFGH